MFLHNRRQSQFSGAHLSGRDHIQGLPAKCDSHRSHRSRQPRQGGSGDDDRFWRHDFSVFLPTFDVPIGQSVEFKTIGIYKEVRGPVILPAQQKVTWRTIQMHGTAETVIVPLEQLVAS